MTALLSPPCAYKPAGILIQVQILIEQVLSRPLDSAFLTSNWAV